MDQSAYNLAKEIVEHYDEVSSELLDEAIGYLMAIQRSGIVKLGDGCPVIGEA